jgi:hypothetical protein
MKTPASRNPFWIPSQHQRLAYSALLTAWRKGIASARGPIEMSVLMRSVAELSNCVSSDVIAQFSKTLIKFNSFGLCYIQQCWASDTQNPGTTWVPYLPRPVRYLPDLLQKSRYLPGRFYSDTQVPEHFNPVHYFSLYLIKLKM